MLMLGYAGLLPFYGFLAGSWWLRDWPAAVSVQGFVIYSLGILSFLGGSLWGRVQLLDEPGAARLIISNGVVLFGVAAVLTAQAWLAAVGLMYWPMPCFLLCNRFNCHHKGAKLEDCWHLVASDYLPPVRAPRWR
jgi:hypothetical protein